MKKIGFLFFLALFTLCEQVSFAQLEASRWYFGNGLGIDFSSGSPTLLGQDFPNQHMDEVDEGHATVCDSVGNFLFYTNGIYVWDKNFNVMYNGGDATGDGLNLKGHWSSSQCATIFPLPGSKTKYIIITTPETQDNTTKISYNVVDLDPATNGGHATGAVTTKNVAMPGGPSQAAEALASCPDANGRDAWVVGHDKNGAGATKFYAWKVTTNLSGNVNISTPVVSSIGDPINASTWPYYGIAVLKFNSCFNRLAMTFYDNAVTQVFSFDNSTGIVGSYPGLSDVASGPLKLNLALTADGSTGDTQHSYGVEFSPNGQYLYVSQSGESSNMVRVFQYNLIPATLTQAAIQAGRKTILSVDNGSAGVRIGHLQLGPDQKIYLTHFMAWNRGSNVSKLSVIASPNTAAPAGFSLLPVSLSWSSTTTRTSMGLPSFHKGFLAGNTRLSAADSTGTTSVSDLGEICVGQAFKFDNIYSGSGANYTWDMDAPATPSKVSPSYGTANGGATAYHRYDVAGDYLIVTTVDDIICGYTVRDTAKVTVKPNSRALPSVFCGDPTINLSVSNAVAGKTYVWYKDAALTQPFAIGSSTSIPYPATNVYVKEVASASSSLVMTDPGSPAIAAGTSSISALPAVVNTSAYNPSYTSYSSASPLKNYWTVKNTVSLNSFKFVASGSWGSPATGVFAIRITNTTTSTVAYQNLSYSGNLVKGNPQLNGNQVGWVTFTPASAISLAPGNYLVEIWKITAGTELDINIFPNLLDNPSITNLFSNTGNGASKTNISDINITYAAVPGVAPTYSTVITATPLACSFASSPSIDCILPVTFLNIRVNESRLISWTTATEINNSYFVVERSYDGNTFEAIGTVAGSGNSSSIKHYSYQDKDNVESELYYRIKQVDIDGNFSYSAIVYVKSSNESFVYVYPNPNNGDFTIKTHDLGIGSIEILNILGTVVYSNDKIYDVMSINLAELAKGTYFLRVSGESKSSIVKFVIN